METARILFCLLCITVAGWRGLPGSSVVKLYKSDQKGQQDNVSADHMVAVNRMIAIAQSQIGVREATGNNDGQEVELYLSTVGLEKGQPWCAAFLSWVFKEAGFSQPKTGWSPALFPISRRVKTASPGLVFGIYIPTLRRVAHCGVVERVNGSWVSGIEGNTSVSGSRDGDGVYRKLRHVKTIYRYADWISKNARKEGSLL